MIMVHHPTIQLSKEVPFRGKQPGAAAAAAQRAKIAEKFHKPPLAVNVINVELNGFRH